MRFRWYILVPLMLAAASAALGSAHVEGREYVALRTKHGACVPLQSVKADIESYVGRLVEVRGKVVGLSKKDKGCTLIISASGGDSLLVEADLPPEENPGCELACLVRVGEGSVHSLADLRLVHFTYDVELRRLEAAWQRDAEKKAASKKAAEEASRKNTAEKKTSQAVSASGQAKKSALSTADTMSVPEFTRIYKNAIKGFNRKLSDSEAETIAKSILGFSTHYKLDPRLVCAVILAESHFNIDATSRAGAQGLGQLMPSTAAGLGVDNAYDPVENIYGSVRYIRSMLDRVSGKRQWNELTWYDLALALAAYNAGPGAVKKYGGIPPYRETQNYVRKVTAIYKKLCEG